jgi:hypothetical protein
MPKASRTPITYRSQFADAMFRPREVVEAELAEEAPSADERPSRARRRPAANERRAERTVERSNDRPPERVQVRHSFDVWQDQLTALAAIQAQRFTATGRKPKIGSLVQEALDAYIATHRERTNERSNERTGP